MIANNSQGDFGKDDWGNWVRGWYVDDLVDNWPSPVKGSWDVPDAVSVYRQVLAAAEDHSVVISAIGFATNIADLLRSGPDDHDSRNGNDLVAAKVKTVVWQGGAVIQTSLIEILTRSRPGWYPPMHGWGAATYNWNCGSEFYDTSGCDGESEYAVNNMPDTVEMIYSDIGDEVRRRCRAANEHSRSITVPATEAFSLFKGLLALSFERIYLEDMCKWTF